MRLLCFFYLRPLLISYFLIQLKKRRSRELKIFMLLYVRNLSFIRVFYLLCCFASTFFLEGCTTNIGHTPDNLEDIVEKNWPLSPPGHGNFASQEDLRLGLKHLLEKKYELASHSFNSAVRLSPQNSLFHYLNALTYHLWGVEKNPAFLSNAEIGYKTSLTLDPGNSLASYSLGQLYMNSSSFKKAQDQFANALLTCPDDPTYLFSLAVASYLCQDVETALEALSSLEKQNISNDDISRVAVLIYAASNNFAKAEENYNNLVQQSTPDQKKLLPYLEKRILSWKNFYATLSHQSRPTSLPISEKPLKEPFKKSLSSKKDSSQNKVPKSSSQSNSGNNDSLSSTDPTSNEDDSQDGDFALSKSQKMIVLNVMILRIERISTQNYGNNLLELLNITAGGYNSVTGINTPAWGTSHDNSRTTPNVRTNHVSLGSLKYSLNIANDTNNHNELVATPSLIATHGQPSNFFSGTDYTLALTSTQGGGNLVSKEVGISISLTPFFLNNGKIVLKVAALRNYISDTPLPGNLNTTSTTPAFQTDKSSVSATSVLSPGESLVLSGLTERVHIKGRSEVPLLGDLPVVSFLFSNDNTQVIERSILFIISPEFSEKIVKDANGNWIVIPDEEQSNSGHLKRLKEVYPKIYSLSKDNELLKKLSEPQYSRNFRPHDMPLKKLTFPNLEVLLQDVQDLTL
ncbi:MAG: hypothetical protein B7Y25_07055 [Alphaproteobacteria bacterium 16-39-46]|nr:MAG: hypothetical protein B7Y25_07055 [Alphaproteobacteria bacterium 16-39-46]